MADTNTTVTIKGITYTLGSSFFTSQETVVGKTTSAGAGDSDWSAVQGTQCRINVYVEGAAYPYGVCTQSLYDSTGHWNDYIYFNEDIFPESTGDWKAVTPYIYLSSAWRAVTPYIYLSSAWRQVTPYIYNPK